MSRGTFDYYAATEEEGGGSRFSPLDGSIIMDSLLRFQTWSKQRGMRGGTIVSAPRDRPCVEFQDTLSGVADLSRR